jgi:His/Glu/Gln/Arg/opine family amino acid ABC transporter permease subunit
LEEVGILAKKVFTRKTAKTCSLIVLLLAIVAVLCITCPSFEDMSENLSPEMAEKLQEDSTKKIKSVTVTDNNLGVIAIARYEVKGRSVKSESYVGFLGHVYDASDGVMKTVADLVNYTYRLLGCGRSVLYGAKLTIFLTFISMISGLFLSIFLALGKISKYKIISKPCSAYIFFFRGTPLMIQIFCIYLTIPGIFDGFSWTGVFNSSDPEAVFKGAFLAAFIAFTLNNAAYCSEIVRAAIQSIDKGQHEAAKALGMNYAQTMRLVILPQSISRLIPPVANEFIMILKDASLVFVIGLQDITTISKAVASNGAYLVFVPAMVIYLIITAFFGFIFNKLEKRFSAYLQ